MMTRNERAAAMRDVYLGFTASADLTWDELPQHHRDRWLAALDAAQPEVPPGVPSARELRDIGIREYLAHPHAAKENAGCMHDPMEAAAAAIRDRVLAGVQAGATVTMIGKTLTPDTFGPEDGTPPPLSDEIIERMARACCNEFHNEDMWSHTCYRHLWCDAIRAALAAVGPQCCPADVAFSSRVPELEKKIDNQRMTLRQLHELREKERAERNILERELKGIKADRDALRAYLTQAEIELADKSFYVREFAAVSAERDGLKKRNDVQAEQLIRIDSEISPLMSEVAELKAELAELKAQPGGWELDVTAKEYADWRLIEFGAGNSIANAQKALDWLRSRIRPAAPRAYTDDDVEKLARVLDATYEIAIGSKPVWEDQSPTHRDRRCAQARAALDWMGATEVKCGECAGIRAERDEINKNYMGLVDLFLPYLRAAQAEAAARAALEGE